MPDDAFVNVMNDPSWRMEGRFFGKYRGIVTENKDPETLGRIQASVPAVSAMAKNWALPCAPYAGNDVGFYTVPPIGAMVWIEFEGGNPNFPIWSGCFWQKKSESESEVPTEVANGQTPGGDADPSQVKVLKTRVATFWIDDTDKKGQVTLQFVDPTVDTPVTVTLLLDSTGLTVTVKDDSDTSTITQTPPQIDTNSKTLTTTSTENTTFTAQKNMTATVTDDLKLEASGNATMKATKDVTVQGQNGTVKAEQNLDLEATSAATLKGTSSVTVQGASATVKADGTLTVQGAMVNIN